MEIWQDILDGSLLEGSSLLTERRNPPPKGHVQDSSKTPFTSSGLQIDDMVLIDDVGGSNFDESSFASGMISDDVVDLDRIVQTAAEKHYSGELSNLVPQFSNQPSALETSIMQMESDLAFPDELCRETAKNEPGDSSSIVQTDSRLLFPQEPSRSTDGFPNNVVYKHGQVSPPSSPENDDPFQSAQHLQTQRLQQQAHVLWHTPCWASDEATNSLPVSNIVVPTTSLDVSCASSSDW